LSHLLPPLTGDQPTLIVDVKRKRATKKKTPNASPSHRLYEPERQHPTPNRKNRLNQVFAPSQEEGYNSKQLMPSAKTRTNQRTNTIETTNLMPEWLLEDSLEFMT
jgi:hypothetical protein